MTLHEHLTNKLELVPIKSDPSLYFSFLRGELVGINGSNVDDLLRAGIEEFRSVSQKTHQHFESSGEDTIPFTFAGFNVSKSKNESFSMDQTLYFKKLRCLESGEFQYVVVDAYARSMSRKHATWHAVRDITNWLNNHAYRR